ncbi:hypothetical protein CPC16_005564 [Podila verticillata]|nr:hypothetical protein BGZ52_007020 [Haplosporangium bisporale]KAF9214156.1 hypothetical protein BGZ59_004213 [Podila verticillata]KAF9389776.1 hypothetical protein CPC16_005564 [Podila verticillata]KFH73318.1 hypothetical protein MVEG_00535 [Podila verticillata NRRL 6337]
MSAKSAMLVAILALFLCLSSTAAALYSPGNPVNCTAVAANCKTFVDSTYLGKNSSYSGPSSQCNVTNLSAAKPLCGTNILCLATFLVQGPSVPAPAPTGNSTNTTTSNMPTGMYVPTVVDVTAAFIDLYDSSKCGTNAAVAQAATSVGAMLIVATIVSVFSTLM